MMQDLDFNSVMRRPSTAVLIFASSVALLLLAMHARMGPALADDGAFFLRYAENIAHGYFWVWNAGEPPVWGASAPLYPLLIALPMKLGFSPEAAIVSVGLGLSSISIAALVLLIGNRYGVIAGVAFLVFCCLDTNLMYFAGSGLETPLTIALMAFGFASLLYSANGVIVGVIAGLLMVNKLDLIPVGGLLVIASWIRDKRFPVQAVAVSCAFFLLWYGFAWVYFGAPVPNSFLTKSLHQNDQPKSIDWRWFGGLLFHSGIHKWLPILIPFSLWALRAKELPILVYLGGTIAIHLIAYTIKYPFEPYNWYLMPSVLSFLILASIGIAELQKIFATKVGNEKISHIAVCGLIVLLAMLAKSNERFLTRSIQSFTTYQEYDRTEAGKWVAAHTPQNFRVFTAWGNPAYYSQREVLDGSFLNRSYENVDLVKAYRPEILILQNNPGSTPMNPVFAATSSDEYAVVKVFGKTYEAGMDYFFAVLARKDVIGQLDDIDPPRDIMPFIHKVELGDEFGTLKPIANQTIFVHPGATKPTTFDFDASGYTSGSTQQKIKLKAEISPNAPQAAIKRGGGDVRLEIKDGSGHVVSRIVKFGQPWRFDFSADKTGALRFIVDNDGNPDTDWLLISIY